jgi:hypothetical protein
MSEHKAALVERMDIQCLALDCENHDVYGCVKGYIEIDPTGTCKYYCQADEDEQEEDKPCAT